MKRILALALLLIAAMTLASSAADAADPPEITGDGIYLLLPGGVPKAIGFDENGVLDTAVPPGSTLYFAIDNAALAGHLSGYSAYLRCTEGAECIETPVTIRYVELFDEEGRNGSYRYAVEVRFFEANYEETPKVKAYVRVGKRASSYGGFLFIAEVQQGPLDAQYAEVDYAYEGGLYEFESEVDYTRLSFGEAARFIVPTPRQRPLDLFYTTEIDTRITDFYPDGEFITLRFPAGPVFDHVGSLSIYAPESYHIFEVVAGSLKPPTFLYDETTGSFVIETRRLGYYILSNIALPEDLLFQLKQNPPTGAR